MDPYVHGPDELDDMAEKLSRLGSGTSSLSRHAPAPSVSSSVDERYDARRKNLSGGMPESPRYPGQDDVFSMPTFDQRPSSGSMQPPVVRQFHRKDSYASERRPSRGSTAGYSLYPAALKPQPTRPLPPIPTVGRQSSRRASSQPSLDGTDVASGDTSRYSQSSRSSTLERVSTSGSVTTPASPGAAVVPPPVTLGEPRVPPQPIQPRHGSSDVGLVPWKQLVATSEKALKEPSVYFFDISTTSATLASKHGNNIIRIWSVGSGEVQSSLKISSYTSAGPRSREYFVRSHAILSEPSNLIAIATGFGDTLEIWDWGKKKRVQTIEDATRWSAVRSNVMEAGWCPLVTYRGDADTLDLYGSTHNAKKPFKLSRSIDFRKANLPLLPKYPELAFSATGPLLVTASGPRPPRLGHPPPERETLLVAWEIHDSAPAHTPYKVVAPWQHAELDTALPAGLATYGSVAVSIWIPASYRAVPAVGRDGHDAFNLAPVAVHDRYVLVWDFAASSTRTFPIPNAASCVSPDCRFVAYCDGRGVESGARGCLAVLDAMTGRMLWCWPDPDAGLMMDRQEEVGVQAALGELNKVTEMCFSADGGFLFVGNAEGGIAVFEVREGGSAGAGGGEAGVSLRLSGR